MSHLLIIHPPESTVVQLRGDAFIALSSSDNENLDACRVARAHGIEHILAFVIEPLRAADFRNLGVQTLTPSLHRSSVLALMARNPALFSLITSTEDQRDLREFVLFNQELDGKRLAELNLPGNILVLAIRRNDEVIVPHGTTRSFAGDHLTVLGDLEALSTVEEWLEAWY